MGETAQREWTYQPWNHLTPANRYGKLKAKQISSITRLRQHFTTETPVTEAHARPQLFPNIPDVYFTENGILNLLSGLDPNKACGPDQVLPRVLKELATQLAPILTDLFNRSYQLGTVPNDWRQANVSPVYQRGKTILATTLFFLHTCLLFTLKLIHSALRSSTPYLGDGYYLPSYLCAFTDLPLSAHIHLIAPYSAPLSHHPDIEYSQQVVFSSYLPEPEPTSI